MKNLKIFFVAIMIAFGFSLNAQVAVSTDGSNAHPSAMLEVKSTEKGLLIPRMTEAERDDIFTPAEGLMVYQTDGTEGFYYYDGTSWKAVAEKTSYTTWVMIDEVTLATDAANITFSGLNGNADGEYRIIGQFKLSNSVSVILRPNNDQTAINYHITQLSSSNNSVTSTQWSNNGFIIGNSSWSPWTFCDGVIQAYSGRPRILTMESVFSISPGSSIVSGSSVLYRSLWRNTTDEITSLVMTPEAGVLQSGTHVELWAKRTINQ